MSPIWKWELEGRIGKASLWSMYTFSKKCSTETNILGKATCKCCPPLRDKPRRCCSIEDWPRSHEIPGCRRLGRLPSEQGKDTYGSLPCSHPQPSHPTNLDSEGVRLLPEIHEILLRNPRPSPVRVCRDLSYFSPLPEFSARGTLPTECGTECWKVGWNPSCTTNNWVRSWARHQSCLSLSFLLCQMGVIIGSLQKNKWN